MPGGQKSRSFNVLPSNMFILFVSRKLKLHHNKQSIHVWIHDSTESPSTETLNNQCLGFRGSVISAIIVSQQKMTCRWNCQVSDTWRLYYWNLLSPPVDTWRSFPPVWMIFVVSRIDCIKLVHLPRGRWHSPQKVREYVAYINYYKPIYMVTVDFYPGKNTLLLFSATLCLTEIFAPALFCAALACWDLGFFHLNQGQSQVIKKRNPPIKGGCLFGGLVKSYVDITRQKMIQQKKAQRSWTKNNSDQAITNTWEDTTTLVFSSPY